MSRCVLHRHATQIQNIHIYIHKDIEARSIQIILTLYKKKMRSKLEIWTLQFVLWEFVIAIFHYFSEENVLALAIYWIIVLFNELMTLSSWSNRTSTHDHKLVHSYSQIKYVRNHNLLAENECVPYAAVSVSSEALTILTHLHCVLIFLTIKFWCCFVRRKPSLL